MENNERETGETITHAASDFGTNPVAEMNARYLADSKMGTQQARAVDGDALAREESARTRAKIQRIVHGG